MGKKQPDYLPNGIYHVYNHANGWENIFKVEDNYRYFLQKMGDYVPQVVDVLAYCLLPNHFHFLVQVKDTEQLIAFYKLKYQLSDRAFEEKGGVESLNLHKVVQQQFTNFLGGYVAAFNKFHKRKGSLLRQNTCRKVVGTEIYFLNAIHYIHLNAVHHGIVFKLEDWPHQSFHSYLSNGKTKLAREKVLDWFGGKEQFIAFSQKPVDPSFGFDIDFEG